MTERKPGKASSIVSKGIQTSGGLITIRNAKIPHLQIFQALSNHADLVNAYKENVLPQKTRTIRLLGRKSPARIIHTLLGYEVKASYKRIQCPDLVTARYLKLFTELGCHSIKLPYDPTLTAQLIPEFERIVEDITAQIRELFPQDPKLQLYVIRRIYRILRMQLRSAV
jgi:hypothetical protein